MINHEYNVTDGDMIYDLEYENVELIEDMYMLIVNAHKYTCKALHFKKYDGIVNK